jgi:hypothetical protein
MPVWAEWLADDAVRAEPVSHSRASNTGKIQGLLQFSPHFLGDSTGKTVVISASCERNSLVGDQGMKLNKAGKLRAWSRDDNLAIRAPGDVDWQPMCKAALFR